MFYQIDVKENFLITSLNSAFRHTYKNDYSFAGESHDFWEIVIVLDGKIGVTAGSDVFMLKKGQAIIHEPMEFHRLWSEESSEPTIIIFSFNATNFPPFKTEIFDIKDLDEPKSVLDKITKCFTFCHNNCIVETIIDGMQKDAQIAIKNLELYVMKILMGVSVKNLSLQSRSAVNYSAIVELLENNLDKNLSISDIAKLLHMSEVTVKKHSPNILISAL